MNKARIFLFGSSLLLLLAAQAAAETRYISDDLAVSVRNRKSTDYSRLELLHTGDAVEVLAEDSNYVEVRTARGVEGFIPQRYLTSELPKAQQITALSQEIETLKEQLQLCPTGDQLEDLKNKVAQINSLTSELEETRAQKQETEANYQQLQIDAANTVRIDEENRQLKEQNSQLSEEIELLRQENNKLLRSGLIRWFLAGAGVLLLGWFIGKLSRRKTRGFSRY